MINRKKHIGAFSMWIAGLIILAHNMIPHHHHFELNLAGEFKAHACCDHYSEHRDKAHGHQANYNKHECSKEEHENHCHPCHFNIETTTSLSKLSLDLFAESIQNGQFFYFPDEEEKLAEGQIANYSSVIHELKPLRGPPPSMG